MRHNSKMALKKKHKAAKKAGKKLTALYKLSSTVAKSGHYENILQKILDITRRAMKIDACSIRLLDEHSLTLELAATAGIPAKFTGAGYYAKLKLGEGYVGRAVRYRRMISERNVSKVKYRFPGPASTGDFRSLLAIPIIVNKKLLGGMTVYFKKPHSFTRSEKEMAGAIVSQAAIAIYNANLYRDSISTIQILAKALESKDTFTKGHSDRVTEYALLLCSEAGVPEKEANLIREICPLHDIGKVGISEKILQKKGPLDSDERAIVNEHPLIGYDILKPIRIFREGLAIVRNHHEWVNGNGYPDKLAGEKIPVQARITAIADAFDAMTSRRPYREALSLDDAVKELSDMSGIQFDARFVKVFLKAVRRNMRSVEHIIETARVSTAERYN